MQYWIGTISFVVLRSVKLILLQMSTLSLMWPILRLCPCPPALYISSPEPASQPRCQIQPHVTVASLWAHLLHRRDHYYS